MGCCQVEVQNYFDYNKHDDESRIRKWEKSRGFFRNTFQNIHSLILIDEKKSKNVEVIKAVLKRNFSEKYLSLLASEEIITIEGEIKMEMLLILIFLTTIHTVTRNKTCDYCDKALFFFSLINKNEEIPADSPIERVNPFMKKVVTCLVDMSVKLIYSQYLKDGNDKLVLYEKNAYNILDEYEDEIVDSIIDSIFSFKGEKTELISFSDLNMIFMKNPNVSKTYLYTNIHINIHMYNILVLHKWIL